MSIASSAAITIPDASGTAASAPLTSPAPSAVDDEDYTDSEAESDEADESTDDEMDEDTQEMRMVLTDVKNTLNNYLNPVRIYERITGREVNLNIAPLNAVTNTVKSKMLDATEMVLGAADKGVDLLSRAAAPSVDQPPTASASSPVPAPTGPASTVPLPSPSSPTHGRSYSQAITALMDAEQASMALAAGDVAATAATSTDAPSTAVVAAAAADLNKSREGKKKLSVGEAMIKDKKRAGRRPRRESRVEGLVSKVGDLGSKLVSVADDHLTGFSYDPTKNNFWGGTITCLDQVQLWLLTYSPRITFFL